METIKFIHSTWAVIVLFLLVIATFKYIISWARKSSFSPLDFRLGLFTLIVSHIQFILGIIYFLSSDYFSELDMKTIMSNSAVRNNIVEHPTTMLIAIILITIGYSKHKKKLSSSIKLKTLSIFYGLALLLVLAKIPWQTWFS